MPLLFLCAFAWAQPSGYVPGTQVCWTFNNRAHGYFKAAGNGERHILLSFTGYGEKTCNDYQNQAPQNLLNDLGTNWDGRTVRAPGDTIVWEIFTLPANAEMWIPDYASDITYFFSHIAPIDTSNHKLFHLQGLSHGVGRLWGYLANLYGHNSPYSKIFSTTISMSGTAQDSARIASSSGNVRSWVWVGEDDAGQTQPSLSLELFNNITGPKRYTLLVGNNYGHGSRTWDSAMSIKGPDTLTNRWLWMVRKDTVTIPPDPCPAVGGPPGYVPGTQVNWQFNNRSHGYFRAAGCTGERHVLIAFTGDASIDSSNYQTNAPQKWLQDAGINWNGKTVRAPGDTILWEVFTIPYNTSYYLPGYANDIAYFFQHIEAIDTSNHNLFHIAGVSHGSSRMWGYLTNDQNHNSPYRNLFSTTIGVSHTWSSIYPAIGVYSAGRRHWVWHGASDTNPTTPPYASTDQYNALNGDKRITMQTGGGHNAITWDSCFSLLGTDSSNNRWLWMVTPPSSLLRKASPEPFKTLPAEATLQVYPNPTPGISRLSWNGKPGITYRIIVTDISGRLRKSIPGIRGNLHALDVSTLEKGLYIVKVEGGGEKFVLKLLKE